MFVWQAARAFELRAPDPVREKANEAAFKTPGSLARFLVGTFEVANPATENPRTITALTILDRASRRAAREFENEPAISSRLLRTTGSIYYNLGLPEESERDLSAALADRGYEVAVCGPATLLPAEIAEMGVAVFRRVEEAIEWAAKIAVACRCSQEVRQFQYDPAS